MSQEHTPSRAIRNVGNFSVNVCNSTSFTNSFEDLADQKYWMYLVIHELYENVAPVESFVNLIANFGKALGDKAQVILPLRCAYKETRRNVLKKAWSLETTDKLAKTKDTYLLVISKTLSSFDPQSKDKFLLIWFPDATSDPFQYAEVLSSIAEEIHEDGDIFTWYFQRSALKKIGAISKRIVSSVEAKPGVFGFSIDLKQLILGLR